MIFWDVDTQVDFLVPGGKLYVPGAEAILPNLARLTHWAAGRSVPVIASVCAHHPGDPEFAVYGPHCLAGTPGQQKVPHTLLPRRFVVPNRAIELPTQLRRFQQVILEKDRLDVFTNPNTEPVLACYGGRLEVILYGVVTEICLALAARGLLARGHRVRVVADAVRALDPAKASDFFQELSSQGGELVNADSVFRIREIPAA